MWVLLCTQCMHLPEMDWCSRCCQCRTSEILNQVLRIFMCPIRIQLVGLQLKFQHKSSFSLEFVMDGRKRHPTCTTTSNCSTLPAQLFGPASIAPSKLCGRSTGLVCKSWMQIWTLLWHRIINEPMTKSCREWRHIHKFFIGHFVVCMVSSCRHAIVKLSCSRIIFRVHLTVCLSMNVLSRLWLG